jgi:hypothetical protein
LESLIVKRFTHAVQALEEFTSGYRMINEAVQRRYHEVAQIPL